MAARFLGRRTGIPCLTSSRLVKVTKEGATVRDGKGVEIVLPADTVIFATVRSPRTSCSMNSNGWWTNCTGLAMQ